MQNSENQATNQNSAQNEFITKARAMTVNELNAQSGKLAVFEYLTPDGSQITDRYVTLLEAALNERYEIIPAECLDGIPQTFKASHTGETRLATKENIKAYFEEVAALANDVFHNEMQVKFTELLTKANYTWQDASQFCESILDSLPKLEVTYMEIDPETGKVHDINTEYARAFGSLQSRFVSLASEFQRLKKELWKAKKEREWATEFMLDKETDDTSTEEANTVAA